MADEHLSAWSGIPRGFGPKGDPGQRGAPGLPGTGGGHTIQDESVTLPNRSYLNFIGAAVVASDNSITMATDVTITAGAPSGPAGGVLSGTYPNPTFVVDMATQAELDSETATRQSADMFERKRRLTLVP